MRGLSVMAALLILLAACSTVAGEYGDEVAMRVGESTYTRNDVVDLIVLEQRLSEIGAEPFDPNSALFDILQGVMNAELAYHALLVGDVHTNTIEGYWSLLKRGLHGTFHSVSRHRLPHYLDEFSYRWNSRKDSDEERFQALLGQTEGRVTWYHRDPATAEQERLSPPEKKGDAKTGV